MVIFSLSECFVLLLLLPVVLRPSFHKAGTPDRIVLFAPVAFLISVLLIFADGLSVTTISVCIVAFLIFFFNIRSLVRCFEKLPIDLYSLPTKFACFLGFVLICATGFMLFKNYPFVDIYRINKSNLAYVQQEKILYTGNFSNGFSPWENKQKCTANFYIFTFEDKPQKEEPKEKFDFKTAWQNLLANTKKISPNAENVENTQNLPQAENIKNSLNDATTENIATSPNDEKTKTFAQNPQIEENAQDFAPTQNSDAGISQKRENQIIVYLPDVFAFVQENLITIKALAAKGYTVISADFFDTDHSYFNNLGNYAFANSFYSRYLATFAPENIDLQKLTLLKTQELNAILSFVKEKKLEENVVCIVADGNAIEAVKTYNKLTNSQFASFALNQNIPGYISGMGNLALLQPAVYNYLQPSPTDGWTQAQIIAQRVQKFIEKQENK